MTYQTINFEISARRIATIRLNRPGRGNAFDQVMLDELSHALASLANDDTRIVVLRGNGRHFCTGADLAKVGTTAPPANGAAKPATLRDVLAALDASPKPTIAVVDGGAIGGGAAFVACCDVAIATEQSFFSIPEVRVGMPPLGVAPFIIRAIGHRAFRRYGLSGERITAAEALRLGLLHEICTQEATDQTADRIADELLHGAPGAIATLKRAAADYAVPSLETILAHQAPHNSKTPEAIEGVASFREKRKPSWYPQ